MAVEDIRILVVEDDMLFAEKLRLDLEEMGFVVVDVVDNAKSALHLVRIARPEIILMDINIKGQTDGILAAQEIFTVDPTPIIFITSLSDKSTFERAKKAHPFAYLLKPANKVSLKHAIELAIENFNKQQRGNEYNFEQFPFLKNNILIKEGQKLIKISMSAIDLVEVEEKYCSIYVNSKKFVVRISLKDIIEKLPDDIFVRVHRNYVINMEKIVALDLENNIVQTTFNDIPLGRKYRADILKNKGYIS